MVIPGNYVSSTGTVDHATISKVFNNQVEYRVEKIIITIENGKLV